MVAFKDQFKRRDPRSFAPDLTLHFRSVAFHAHTLACRLVGELPDRKLAEICRLLSRRLIEDMPGLGLDRLSELNLGERPKLAASLDFGPQVKLPAIYGAFALWKLADLQDLVGPVAASLKREYKIELPAEVHAKGADMLIAALRACLLGQHFQLLDAQEELASGTARRNVLIRHENTTNKHRREAIRRAAKFHAEGRFSKPTEAARFLMNDIEKGDGSYYSEKTICTWLWRAGWTQKGWPNRPDTE